MTDIVRRTGRTSPLKYQCISKETGLPVDITGWTFTLVVDPEQHPASSSANVITIAGVVTDAANGKFEFRPTPTDAATVYANHYFDAKYTNASGKVGDVDSGTWNQLQAIS